jgi:hypothetical protein
MKKDLFRNCVLSLAFLMLAATGALTQTSTITEVKTIGGIATLYALDPLAHTFSFGDGREGGVFYQNEIRNRASDIDFGNYNDGAFSVGVEGGRIGVIIDLGTPEELKRRYGYGETVGNGQGFASLRAAGGKIFIFKDRQERQTHSEQELNEAAPLFAGGKSSASAPVKLGHIYLVRLTDTYDKTFERIVKLVVISYAPGESATFRWQVL